MHKTESTTDPSNALLDFKCCSCQRAIHSTDWVRRAKQNIYHLACFSCDVCKRQLSTGEEFSLSDEMILCKLHYVEQLDLPASILLDSTHGLHVPFSLSEHTTNGNIDAEMAALMKTNQMKRMRTSFSDAQVQVLQANFDIDANPDSTELERIASDVNLPKRVVQVWFQNSRSRQKKQQQQNQTNS